MRSTICLAEDREACEPALKLLLLSLTRHSPTEAVSLFYPPARGGFVNWLKRCPQVRLETDCLTGGYGWNVKPQALMWMIERGFDQVIWIDSDVIINRDVLGIFARLESNTLVATEDALGDNRDHRDALRARLWGFPVGRVFPFGLNSGAVRATAH